MGEVDKCNYFEMSNINLKSLLVTLTVAVIGSMLGGCSSPNSTMARKSDGKITAPQRDALNKALDDVEKMPSASGKQRLAEYIGGAIQSQGTPEQQERFGKIVAGVANQP